ncbi:ATP-binding protein [Pseudonocardia sp. 73-21]|uniref:sensor histidine kinase n=1 Tax=Pseudonocardia sp. 73-21 TaxID=1895809 RepID=UPI003432AD5B
MGRWPGTTSGRAAGPGRAGGRSRLGAHPAGTAARRRPGRDRRGPGAGPGQLPAAAARQRADLTDRYPRDVETCVHFCCLEAIQIAGEHAGAGAEIMVHVDHTDGTLRFRVTDDGPGFDAGVGGAGHGFVNMRGRPGVVGGTLEITSGAGGTTVVGTIPGPT